MIESDILSALTLQGLEFGLLLVRSFRCSPCVSVHFLLPLKNMALGLLAAPKLPGGLNECLNECVNVLYDAPQRTGFPSGLWKKQSSKEPGDLYETPKTEYTIFVCY